MYNIEELQPEDFDKFFTYLREHLSDNNEGPDKFQPISREENLITAEWSKVFLEHLGNDFGSPRWRKLWVAKHSDGRIAGHADIRSRPEQYAQHRVLLGMGVDGRFRKNGIGQRLLGFVVDYCRGHHGIQWLDIEVLTNNTPAINLYLKNDAVVIGNTVDMFRIDGESFAATTMVLKVG